MQDLQRATPGDFAPLGLGQPEIPTREYPANRDAIALPHRSVLLPEVDPGLTVLCGDCKCHQVPTSDWKCSECKFPCLFSTAQLPCEACGEMCLHTRHGYRSSTNCVCQASPEVLAARARGVEERARYYAREEARENRVKAIAAKAKDEQEAARVRREERARLRQEATTCWKGLAQRNPETGSWFGSRQCMVTHDELALRCCPRCPKFDKPKTENAAPRRPRVRKLREK